MTADLSKEEILALATPNAELEKILAVNPLRPSLSALHPDQLPALRVRFTEAKKAANAVLGASFTGVEEDRKIPIRDGTAIDIRIHSPKSIPADGSPVLVFFHGGGFVVGGLENEVTLCRWWAETGGVAVNVDYRHAPENPFPAAVEDAYDAVKWVGEHAAEIGVNPKKGFIIGGTSAGANLAAVVTHQYRDAGLSPPLTGQYLAIPAVCVPESVPDEFKEIYLSREQCKSAMVIDQTSIDFFGKCYAPPANSPLFSPLIFPSHKDLPPLYIQVCGGDPLRDEGLIYEKALRASGVKTKLDIFPGLPHGFWTWWPEAEFSKDFTNKTQVGLKWLLEQV